MIDPSVLLLQARHSGDPARVEERESFARHAELEPASITTHDLLEGPPSLSRVREHDILMVGGAGDFYVSKGNLPHQDETLEFLRKICELEQPTFASCFGFQLMVEALGGQVVFDAESTEVGTYDLELTPAAQDDPLFASMPQTFKAQMGRKDRATELPESCSHLATSEACPFQALRVANRPIWATQFHPELDGAVNRSRYVRYLSGYAEHLSEEEQQEALSRFEESPATTDLLARFVTLVSS